jgi:hypothetical protein
MIDRKRANCGLIRLAVSALGLLASCGQAFSQSAPAIPSRQVFYSTVKPLTDIIDQEQKDPRPQTAGNALQALDWLIFGNAAIGGTYDDNVFDAPNKQAVYGARFQPSIIAERNTGIQRTLIYGIGDLRYYPSIGKTDLYGTNAGIEHVWEIQRDLIFRTQFDAARQQENSSLLGALSGSGTYYVKPINYTSLFASTSIEKRFGRFFAAIGGSVTGNIFDDTTDSLGNNIDEHFQDGTRTTFNSRIGYHITPIVYGFIEPSANWGRFQSSKLDSDGYRIVGGLGTARISLFNGEIYAGVLTEHFSDPATPTLNRSVFGGRLSWYPTRFLTFTGSYDQSFGTSDFSPTIFNPGSVTKVDTSKLLASWSMRRDVKLDGSVQHQHIEYLNSARTDSLLQYDLKISYRLTEKLGVYLEDMYSQLSSNTSGVAYNRNLLSLGATSKF